MVVLNYSGEEINAKIVYYGPGLGGKTTNLEYIHEKMPVRSKGKLVSMKTRTDRTLFFDFLPLELGEIRGYRTRFLLYTVPGQVYYNATRKLVLKGVDAVVFVADSSRSKLDMNIESLRNLEENLNEHGLSLDHLPWVIQYNKRDLGDAMPIAELHENLNLLGVPAYESIATQGVGVYDTFQGVAGLLFEQLRARLDRGEVTRTSAQPDHVNDAVETALRESATNEPPPTPIARAQSVGSPAGEHPAGQPPASAQERPAAAPAKEDAGVAREPVPAAAPRPATPSPEPSAPSPDARADERIEAAATASDAARNEAPPEFIIDPMGRPRPEPAPERDAAPAKPAAPEPATPEPPAQPAPGPPAALTVPVRVPRSKLRDDSGLRIELEILVVDE